MDRRDPADLPGQDPLIPPASQVLPGARPALEVLSRLARRRGQPVWLVGGALRDLLLGATPPDVDLAAAGDALELGRRWADELGARLVVLQGERFAACRLVLPGLQLDLSGLRAPDLEGDLAARDFTINALALPLEQFLDQGGRPIDPTGGLADLTARLIRPAGPGVLAADPLRVLRAFRFLSSLEFKLAPGLEKRLRRRAGDLPRVPKERIAQEWLPLMAGPGVAQAVTAMDRMGVLGPLLPELEAGRGLEQNPYHHLDVLEHCLATLGALAEIHRDPGRHLAPPLAGEAAGYLAPARRRALVMTAALLHDVGKPPTREPRGPGWATFYRHESTGAQLAGRACRRLGLPKRDAQWVARMVGEHMRPFHLMGAELRGQLTTRAVRRLLAAAGEDLPGLFLLAMADTLAGRGPQRPPEAEERLLNLYRRVARLRDEQLAAALAAPPLIDGRRLMQAVGIGPGPEVGRLLAALREAQLDGEIHTPQEAEALARRLAAAQGALPGGGGGGGGTGSGRSG